MFYYGDGSKVEQIGALALNPEGTKIAVVAYN